MVVTRSRSSGSRHCSSLEEEMMDNDWFAILTFFCHDIDDSIVGLESG